MRRRSEEALARVAAHRSVTGTLLFYGLVCQSPEDGIHRRDSGGLFTADVDLYTND